MLQEVCMAKYISVFELAKIPAETSLVKISQTNAYAPPYRGKILQG